MHGLWLSSEFFFQFFFVSVWKSTTIDKNFDKLSISNSMHGGLLMSDSWCLKAEKLIVLEAHLRHVANHVAHWRKHVARFSDSFQEVTAGNPRFGDLRTLNRRHYHQSSGTVKGTR